MAPAWNLPAAEASAHPHKLVALPPDRRSTGEGRINREVSMKTTVFAALWLASTLAAGTASAQPAPFNEVGVTMGHWHIASRDVEANKKIFVGMGGKWFKIGMNEYTMFPGVFVHLNLGDGSGTGGSQG